MHVRRDKRRFVNLWLLTSAVVVLSSCGGGGSRPTPPPSTPAPVPGATTVNGTERLAWSQETNGLSIRFRAYVDGNPVALEAARCDDSIPAAACSSPLPALTNGVHTIALAAVYEHSGLESERSTAITVQKVSASSVSGAASVSDARAGVGEARRDGTDGKLVATDVPAFTVELVARTSTGSVQMAATTDGRLLVAEADGRVRLIHADGLESHEPAFDARTMLDPPPLGSLGVAMHPDFVDNQFVYVSFLAHDGSERTLLRIVRLREAGGTLGEAATIFEAPLSVTAKIPIDGQPATAPATPTTPGPRMAFGPDGLLYALLPPGLEFDREPAASRPRASMLRLRDDGRVPDAQPLPDVVAHPLGFAWHPATAALLAVLPGDQGTAVVRALGGAEPNGRATLRAADTSGDPATGALVVQEPEAGALDLARAFADAVVGGAAGSIRLAVPVAIDALVPGMAGRVLDVVAPGGGTVYLAVDSAGNPGSEGGQIMRLRLRAR